MITVVIPALNEAESIAATVGQVQTALRDANLDAEILVVDDGSTDGTGDLAERAGARVLRHPMKSGYGRAIKAGIKAAQADTIVVTDADLTYPARAIPALLEEYDKGFDMVVGLRQGDHVNERAVKAPLRMILKGLVQFVAERPVPDVNSGLRVFSKQTIEGYLKHLCDTFSFSTSLTLAYMLTGRFVGFVPIDYHERVGKTKVRLFWDSLRTLQYIAQSVIYYNPLKLFFLVAGLCILLAILGFIMALITGLNAPYYLGIGGLLVAMLVFCLGLLADLLRQIMDK